MRAARHPVAWACLAAVLVAATSGRGAPIPPRAWVPPCVVTVSGDEAWMARSPVFGLTYAGAHEGLPAAMLLRDGDLIWGKDFPPFPYRTSDGLALAVTKNSFGVILRGGPVTVFLGDDAAWEWLKGATPEEVSALRLVGLGGEAGSEQLDLVQKIADANPHVGLFVTDGAVLDQALAMFSPQRLWVERVPLTQDLKGRIATQSRLETLLLMDCETSDLGFLARVPMLHTLIIGGWCPEKMGPLPDGLNVLGSLQVHMGEMKDLSALGRLPRLEELVLVNVQGLTDIGGVADLANLRTLVLQGCGDVTDLEPLRNLKNLRWLALPPATPARQLDDIVRDHPDLEVLVAVGCGNVTDLACVRRLGNLTALLVATPAPAGPLYHMKGLTYLAVGETKDGEDWAQTLAALRHALPETTVVRVAPLCLGSGWILLLLPAAVAAWWLARRARAPTWRGRSPHRPRKACATACSQAVYLRTWVPPE